MTIPAPSLQYVEERFFDTLQDPFPAGRITRSSRFGKRIRIYTLRYFNVPSTDRDALRTEFLAAKGRAGTTTFTPIDEGSPVTVRFADDDIEFRQVTGNTYEFECRLVEEVF